MRQTGHIIAPIAILLVAMYVVLMVVGISPRIATAAVAGATIAACTILFLLRWANHRIPLSLRIFVAVLVLLAIGSALRLGIRFQMQREAFREIERLGGTIGFTQRGPKWLRKCLGDDWMKPFDSATSVCFNPPQSLARDMRVDNRTMSYVARLDDLRSLDILYAAWITNTGISRLKNLPNLTYLNLFHSWNMSDAAIADLNGALPKLRVSRFP